MLIVLALTAVTVAEETLTPAGTARTAEQRQLPTYRSVTFTVFVPDNTPPSDTVYLLLLPFYDWEELQRIPMTANGDGAWSASAELEEATLIRYVYDRGWTDWAEWRTTRERFNQEVEILYRYLFVEPTASSVEDTVARWNDIDNAPPTGTITGSVTDSATGEPIMDATVSIGGVHTATNYDGSFTLRDLPVGSQRVTVMTTLGDYRYASKVVQVYQGETSTLTFDLVAAKKVRVTFDVVAPEDTPSGSVVKLVGSVFQMGSYHGPFPNYGFTAWPSSRYVSMDRVSGDTYTATLELYEGTYVRYMYTLGLPTLSNEWTSDGGRVLRSFIVGGSDELRRDVIVTWRPPDWVAVTFNLTVPPNTPTGERVGMSLGPIVSMDRVSDHNWVFTLFAFPGSEFQYRYVHGWRWSEAFEPDDSNALRTITVPDEDTIINDRVERWRWYPRAFEPLPGDSIRVTFRVTVPLNTPAEDTVYLAGNSTEVGSYLDPRAVPLTRSPTNDWLWEAEVTFDSPKKIEYRYTRGDFSRSEDPTRTLHLAYDGQTVDDAVFSWTDIPFSLQRDFISAIYPADYWTPEFLALYEPTLTRIRNHNAEWVAVSSVWSYSQVEPLPEVEPRPIRVGGVLNPTEDLVAEIDMIHSMGLKAIVYPQFNMEVTPGGWDVFGAHPNEWWDRWLEEAEKLYLYNAEIAERTGAEMLLLPGFGFRVFPREWQFEDPLYVTVFDQKMQDLIGKVRQRYGGLLVADVGWWFEWFEFQPYDFPDLLDFALITSGEWGTDLGVSPDASVQEIRVALENVLDDHARPIFERYDKPVIVQLSYGSVDNTVGGAIGDAPWGPDDPSTVLDLMEQANIYEAFFQAIMDRPWVGGLYDFGYDFSGFPVDESLSIRAKPAEAVVSKYYRVIQPTVLIDEGWVTDERADVGSVQSVYLHAKWKHDLSPVTSGTIYVNGQPYSPDDEGWIVIQHTQGEVGEVVWTVTSVDAGGIANFQQLVDSPSVIWDRVEVELAAPSARVDVASSAPLSTRASYAYDGAPFEGRLHLSYDLVQESVGRYSYTVLSIEDQLYGLSAFTSNSVDVIFDRVSVELSVADDRIDVGSTAQILVEASYVYDGAPFEGEVVFSQELRRDEVGAYDYTVGEIEDPLYGLTAFTSNTVRVIFDRVLITLSVAEPDIQVGETAEIGVRAAYAYDGTRYPGKVTLNEALTKDVPGSYRYTVESIGGDAHGITVFESNAVTVTFFAPEKAAQPDWTPYLAFGVVTILALVLMAIFIKRRSR